MWWRGHSSRPLARVVLPPRLHGRSWWAWHQAAGIVHPSTVQHESRTVRASDWAALKPPAPGVQHLPVAAEDCRYHSCLAGQHPRLSGRHQLSGGQGGGLQAVEQRGQLHRDDHGDAGASCSRKLVDREPLDVLAERFSEDLGCRPLGQRLAVLADAAAGCRARPLGRGQSVEGSGEHRAVDGRDPEGAVAGA